MENQKTNFFERLNAWLNTSTTIRLIVIGILILLLLIPVNMIKQLIHEREYRKKDAINEITAKWGNYQLINGLVLTIPYYEYSIVIDDKDEVERKTVKVLKYAHFLPENLEVKGNLITETRYRGIYDVVVYNAEIHIKGKFNKPDFKSLNIENHIMWDDAVISLGISDTRTIQDNIELKWNGESILLNPGIITSEVINSGLSTEVTINDDSLNKSSYDFSLKLNINGSSGLQFIPLGKETKVVLNSNWSNPSFDGAFLPDHREITTKGFQAEWKILHLNRKYPQQFKGSTNDIQESGFGVNLIEPVDEYQKSMRSVKYAVLFIVLTFVVFFLIQVINKIRIHPFQYILIGLALCVFYILLISISEHLDFTYAYLIGGIAIVALNSVYARSIFKSSRFAMILALVMSLLYAFIYVIIQLQDFALLVGSIGLFAVLAMLMYFTRNIDWYRKED